jgi:hypothetical protein
MIAEEHGGDRWGGTEERTEEFRFLRLQPAETALLLDVHFQSLPAWIAAEGLRQRIGLRARVLENLFRAQPLVARKAFDQLADDLDLHLAFEQVFAVADA